MMKNILKVFLVSALCCTFVLADDGDMGNGTKPKPCTNCLVENQPTADKDDSEMAIIKLVREYLFSIFK